jgi:hypothetical protein
MAGCRERHSTTRAANRVPRQPPKATAFSFRGTHRCSAGSVSPPAPRRFPASEPALLPRSRLTVAPPFRPPDRAAKPHFAKVPSQLAWTVLQVPGTLRRATFAATRTASRAGSSVPLRRHHFPPSQSPHRGRIVLPIVSTAAGRSPCLPDGLEALARTRDRAAPRRGSASNSPGCAFVSHGRSAKARDLQSAIVRLLDGWSRCCTVMAPLDRLAAHTVRRMSR